MVGEEIKEWEIVTEIEVEVQVKRRVAGQGIRDIRLLLAKCCLHRKNSARSKFQHFLTFAFLDRTLQP